MSVSVEDYRPETTDLPAPRPAKKGSQATMNEALDELTFEPVRVWTAGPGMPQEDIYTEGLYGRLRPYLDGAYYCKTPKELEIAKKALGPRFWIDNISEDDEALKCDQCGWSCRSTKAITNHLNHAHGRAQTV